MNNNYLSANFILNPLLEIKGYPELQDTLTEEKLNKEELHKETLVKIKEGKLFLLAGQQKTLLINDTIRSFLEQFVTANNLDIVSKQFAAEVHASVPEVLPTVGKFLEDMLWEGVIIPIDRLEEALAYKEAAKEERKNVFPVDSTIEGYKIIKTIAKKNNFDLYLAEDLANQRQVAIKTLYLAPEDVQKSVAYRKQLLKQEFGLLQEVSGHPNVCEYVSMKIDEEHAFGVMEYIEGQDLGSYLKKNTVDLAEKTVLIQQLFDGMAHVHACGIVHGDLHKSNFIVNTAGKIKVFDFDLSNHRELQEGERLRVGGVYKYFPPEKIRKNSFHYIKEPADYLSEVYQVGIIAYYILYERLPFTALSWSILAEKIKKEKPVFDLQLANGEAVPLPLIALLEKALAKKPKKRFKSIKSLSKKWAKATLNSSS